MLCIVSQIYPTNTPQAGVKDIVLAVNYRPEVMVAMLKKTEEEYGITINFSVETEPLGTGECLSLLVLGILFYARRKQLVTADGANPLVKS